MAKSLKFEIVETIAVLGENLHGWTKEVNLVSWNGRPAKYDIREWDETHESMSKGVTLSREEFIELISSLQELDVDEIA